MLTKQEMEKMTCIELYSQVNKRLTTALMMHANMSDYFNFIGLHGFEKMHEHQYHAESIEKRKLNKKVLDAHNKLIPEIGHDKVDVIPSDWYKHTRMDIDDAVLPKFVRTALKTYREWEEETKQLYSDVCHVLFSKGMMVDYNIMNGYLMDVQCELKKLYRLCEQLNGVGYDVVYIVEMQKEVHDEYDEKMKHLKI